MDTRYRWRRSMDQGMTLVCLLCTVLVLTPLALVLAFLAQTGLSALNWDFFTKLPGAAGEPGGGMANAITGTLILIGLAGCLGIPIGVLGGTFLSEYPQTQMSRITRFAADVMNGIPSIVMGLFAYVLIVLPLRHFSALAGGVALGVMLIPTVMRTTEEVVRLVPQRVREAALALGIPQWKTTLRVVLPTAAAGIVTGIMVALARIAGETAPLLDWHRQAWAGALVLVAIVLVVNVAARYATSRQVRLR